MAGEDSPKQPRQLRRHKSTLLDSQEEKQAVAAAVKWKEAIENDGKGLKEEAKGAESDMFTFAKREDWPKFQKLLLSIGQTRENEKEEGSKETDCELETDTDLALHTYDKIVSSLMISLKERLSNPGEEAFLEETFVTSQLKNCIFVGHLATDLDSIAGAVGAADLYGGIAAKSEVELNGEIKYVLKEVAGLEEPALFDDIPGGGIPCTDELGNKTFKKICLVDHNEEKQMVKSLRDDPDRRNRIIGLIDHHALSSSFCSDKPLLIDLRPWGSMASIVAHMYLRNNRSPGEKIARLLMCAILSDTLNLQSVTTTNADRFAVAFLAKIGDIEDPDEVARLMFRAKTSWIVNLGPYAMVRGDQKDFAVNGWKFGIAVLEVTTIEPVLQVADELIMELRSMKIEKGNGDRKKELDFAFLFVVNVAKQCSVLLVCGGREYALAKLAFEGCPFQVAKQGIHAPGKHIKANETLLDVGPLVSRKAQFVPAFSRILNQGFSCHKAKVSSDEYVDDVEDVALRSVLEKGQAPVSVNDQQELKREFVKMKSAVFLDMEE